MNDHGMSDNHDHDDHQMMVVMVESGCQDGVLLGFYMHTYTLSVFEILDREVHRMKSGYLGN